MAWAKLATLAEIALICSSSNTHRDFCSLSIQSLHVSLIFGLVGLIVIVLFLLFFLFNFQTLLICSLVICVSLSCVEAVLQENLQVLPICIICAILVFIDINSRARCRSASSLLKLLLFDTFTFHTGVSFSSLSLYVICRAFKKPSLMFYKAVKQQHILLQLEQCQELIL